jgi:uncharacterized protein
VARSRPNIIVIAMVAVLALFGVVIVVDTVRAGFDLVSSAVSGPTTSTAPAARYDEFTGNALHADRRMPEVSCALPEFVRDAAGLAPYYRELVSCLDAVWAPVLKDAGFPVEPPSIDLAPDPARSPCGIPDADDHVAAWYCSANRTLYLPGDRIADSDTGRPYFHIATVAHEYGHHVQEVSGLLALANSRMGAAAGKDAANEVSRRLELQANCFAGLFLAAVVGRGSITRPIANGAIDSFVNATLLSTHGNGTNQSAWTSRGYTKGTTSACNTWAAPASEVSD